MAHVIACVWCEALGQWHLPKLRLSLHRSSEILHSTLPVGVVDPGLKTEGVVGLKIQQREEQD